MATTNFDGWFAAHYHTIRTKTLPCNLFGELLNTIFEDMLHDAFLVARIMAKDATEREYKVIFKSAWKSQLRRHSTAKRCTITPKDLFWSLLSEESEYQETKDFQGICQIVLEFAKTQFSKSEYEIFLLYYKNGLTEHQIADYCGVSQVAAHYRLAHMKQVLCAALQDVIYKSI